MQIKLLKDIVVSVAGPNAEKIVDLLYGKKNINEFLIAKKLDLNINQTRNILYKLSEFGLVSFIRKKDQKNGGWYTYFWTLDIEKSLLTLRGQIEKEIKSFDEQLHSRQSKRFYYCPECGMEMTEENALIYNFTCPECGEVLQLRENKEIIDDLVKRINDFKGKLELVSVEIDAILKKGDVARKRKVKAEEKKKVKERVERKRIRDLEKGKTPKEKKPKKVEKKVKSKKITKKKIPKKTSKKTPKKTNIKKSSKKTAKRK